MDAHLIGGRGYGSVSRSERLQDHAVIESRDVGCCRDLLQEGFGRLLLALQCRGATCGLQSVQAVGLGGEVHFRRFTEYSVLKALPYEAQFFGRQRKTIEGARDQLAERVQRA